MIGVSCETNPNDGLETYQLEDNDYLVVNAKGKVPQSIRQAMRQIHQELIPTENIQLKRAPFSNCILKAIRKTTIILLKFATHRTK